MYEPISGIVWDIETVEDPRLREDPTYFENISVSAKAPVKKVTKEVLEQDRKEGLVPEGITLVKEYQEHLNSLAENETARLVQEGRLKKMATNPMTCKIILISAVLMDSDEVFQFYGEDETKVLTDFHQFLYSFDKPNGYQVFPFVGYNSLKFDAAAVNMRSAILGIDNPYHIPNRDYRYNDHVDLMTFLHGRNFVSLRTTLQMFNIDETVFQKQLRADSPFMYDETDEELLGNRMREAYEQGNWDDILYHGGVDVLVTKALYRKAYNVVFNTAKAS